MNHLMRGSILSAAVIVAVAVSCFGLGYTVHGTTSDLHPPTTSATCLIGAVDGSCSVGSTSYGVQSSVSWTDGGGVFHQSGWPDCLPKMSQVEHVQIQADWIALGTSREARVFWVNCQGS
jgi:hypothetical protein